MTVGVRQHREVISVGFGRLDVGVFPFKSVVVVIGVLGGFIAVVVHGVEGCLVPQVAGDVRKMCVNACPLSR